MFPKETDTTETPLVQQKFIQNMLNSLQGAIVVLDQKCKIVYVNNEWIESAGSYGANYFKVTYLTTLQSDGEQKQFRTRIKEILTGKSDRFEQDYFNSKSKETLWIRIEANGFDSGATRYLIINHQNITEQKKYQAELLDKHKLIAEQKELLEKTLDALMQPLYIIDVRDYTVKFTNAAAQKYGIPPASTCHKLIHHSDTPCGCTGHICPLNEIKKTPKPVEVEHVHMGANGEKQYFEVHGYPIFDKDGILVQMIEFSINITERKLVEEELERSEKKFRDVFNSITDVFTRTNMEGNCILISPSVFKVTGFSVEEIIGKNLSEFYSNPEDRDTLSQLLQESGSVHHYETEIIKKDGSKIIVSANAKIIYNNAGEPQGIESVIRDVTDLKKTEQALQLSETNLVKAQEVGHIGSWSLDLIKNNLVWTDENYRIFGIPKGTPMSYDKFIERAHPEDRDYVNKKWSAAIKGEPYDIQHRILIDNEIKWVREKAELVFDSKKNPISAIGITQDINERKLFEKELEEKENEFRFIFENALVGIGISDLKGKILLANSTMYKLFGPTPEGISNFRLSESYVDPSERMEILRRLKKDGVVENYEVQLYNSMKEIYWAHLSTVRIKQANEERILTSIIDISERKNAEGLLEKSYRQLQKAEKTALMGSIDWNLKTNKMIWSKELYNLYGVEQGIPVSIEKIVRLVHPDDLGYAKKNLEMALQGDNNYNIDHRIIRPDKKVIWVSSRADVEHDKMGKPSTLLGIVIDITERKQAEQKIMQYKDHLKELASELTITEERLRKQIAIDLHDDVGQLLASARMQLGTINNEMDTSEVPKKIKSVSQSLAKAIQFTRDAIFNLSPPQLSEIGLYAAIHDWMKEQIETKYGINTHISSEKEKFNLEDTTRLLLFRSIRELLINVVKHARAKNLNVNILTQNGMMEIRIQDDGIGFDSKSDLTRLKSKGYGLFSIQERMEDLGGYMKIESNPGKGSEIKLVLPLNKDLS